MVSALRESNPGKEPVGLNTPVESLFPYLKRQIKIFPVSERILAGYKIICLSLPWGRVSKEKIRKNPPATIFIYPPRQSSNVQVPAGFVLQMALLVLPRVLLRSMVLIHKQERNLNRTTNYEGKHRLVLWNTEVQHKLGSKLQLEYQAAASGCTVAFQAQPHLELLTGSSFFCIQLYFLLGFSSRGSRMVFRLSIKGVESTSMSMWVLAASKLSSVGRTGKLSGPGEGQKKKL